MTTAKFDLANALIADGFQETARRSFGGYDAVTYSKKWSKPVNDAAWYGVSELTFSADIEIHYYLGKPGMAIASYSNGKVKEHDYNKRTYNAVRDTVKFHGFDIAR